MTQNGSALIVDVPRSFDLIDDGAKHIYELVNYVIFCNIFSVFGVFSNMANIIVFYRQGLNSTVNISFTGLAVSDLCSLVTLLWFNVCVNPLFVNSGVPMSPSEVQHLTGGFPHACFARITCWITVYVTGERCLCVILPLKVRRIITTRRATSIIVGIYVLMIASLLPEYTTMHIGWKDYPEKNRSLLGLIRTKDNEKVSGLTFLLYAVYILVSAAGFIVPVFFVVGQYANIFFVTWSFAFMLDSLNSSTRHTDLSWTQGSELDTRIRAGHTDLSWTQGSELDTRIRAGHKDQSWTHGSELDARIRAGHKDQSWTHGSELDARIRAGHTDLSWTQGSELDTRI
ncbi:hypothetical protein Btru_025308 [Bulinus truncatus]|nr:hypothetical protein Btru_025308 [Bulinus truncatus]